MKRTFTPIVRSKVLNNRFYLIAITLLLSCFSLQAQQVIGTFPYMNGGFEGQSAGALATTISATNWTRQNQSGASTTLTTSASARSGSNYITVVNVASASRAAQSPQTATAANGPTSSTAYTVQFFVKNALAVNGFQGGVTVNGTANPTYSAAATLAANATWTKQTFALTTLSNAVATAGIGVVRSTAGNFDVDDFVIYAGALDNTVPDVPGTVTVNNATTSTLDVSWSAPGTGVDGGGYVVVRYTSNPDPTDDPNANGIYAVGNTFTVVNAGTVVYTGTGTSFTDNTLSSASTYYYKVYTADKAFNYSTESSGNGTTSGAGATIVLSSPSQITAANQNQGAASVVLSQFQADVTGSTVTLNTLVATTGGTYIGSDITNFKLWYNSTNTFSGAAQIGTTITSISASGATVSFTGLSQATAAATSGYYFITADLAVTATATSTINIAANPVLTFASGSVSGTITAGGDQTFVPVTPSIAISSVHPAAGFVAQNSTNNILATYQFDVTVANALLTDITVTTAGTYQASDIQTNGFKIWVNTTNTLSGATQLGSGIAVVASGANLVFSSLGQTFNASTTHYIFVTADIALGAQSGNNISITSTVFSNFTFASGVKTGTDPVAASNAQTVPTASIAIASNHPAAGNVYNGTQKVILAGMSFAVTSASTTLTSVTASTAGTYVVTDLLASPFKLWYNTTNTIAGATQLGTTQSVVTSGNAISFTGLSQTIAAGVTGYIFITADIATSVTASNTIGIAAIAFSDIIFASGVQTGVDPVGASNMKTLQQFAFTPGQLVANRVGDGSTTLSSAAGQLEVVQLSTTGSNLGSVVLPSGASGTRVTNSGSATSEGHITLSADAQKIAVVGYDAVAGTASVASSTVSRVVALVDAQATVDVSTVLPTAYTGNNIRGAVVNGNQVWTAGPGAGVVYTTVGTNGNGTSVVSSGSQRFPAIFGYVDSIGLHKQLYCGIGAIINSVGTGLPTSTATPTAVVNIASAATLQYVVFDANPLVAGLDLIYVSNKSGTGVVGGVYKYYFDGTTWQAAGSYTGEAVCGLTGNIDAAGQIHLFITSGTSTTTQPTNVYSKIDNTGETGSISGSFTGTLIATSGTNYALRGLAWTPTSITSQPSNAVACAGTNTVLSIAMQTGAGAVYDYFWQRSNDGGSTWANVTLTLDGSVYTNVSTANLSIAASSFMNGYKYRCLVRYMSQYWLESDTVSLTVNDAPQITSQSNDTTVCGSAANAVQLSVTATGTNLSYAWEVSSNNGASWTALSNDAVYNNVTSANLSITNAVASMNGYQFHCIVSGTCISPDTSANIILSVTTVVANNTASGAQTICSGSTPTTLTGSTPTGGDGVTYNYAWLSSTTDATTGFAAATGTNNTVDYSPAALTQNTWYKRVVSSGVCSNDTTAAIAIIVTNPIATNTASGAQTICSGSTPTTLTGSTPTGGDGVTYNYVWLSSTTDATTGFTAAAGTNNAIDYSPAALTQNTWYKRVVSSGVCSNDTTAAIAIIVTNPIATNTASGAQTICSGSTPTTLTGSTPTGGDGVTYNYAWLSSTTDATTGFTAAAGTNNAIDYSPAALTQTTWYKRVVSSGICANDTTAAIAITVNTAGTWTGATNADWNNTANWSCPLVPNNATNVMIPVTANMPVITDAQQAADITIAFGATLTLNASASQLSVYGNIVNNGTFTNTNGKVVFAGASAQTIPAGTYAKVEVNNSSNVSLGGAVTLSDSLLLTNGKVTIGANNLTITTVSVGNDLRYISTNGTGAVTLQNVGASTVVLPVGNSTYNPVFLSNTGTIDNFTVSVIDSVTANYSGNTPTGLALTNGAVNRTWIINEAVAGGSNASVTLQWNAADELSGFTRNASYLAHHNGTTWMSNPSTAASGSNPYRQGISGITSFSPFGVGSGNALPVQLLSFAAAKQSKNVNVSWTTASELNNNYFELQRSLDGKTFVTITTVKGKGTTNAVSNYSYFDTKVGSLSVVEVYYRLVQTDFDGTKTTSKTVVVNMGEPTANSQKLVASVSPNPFTDITNVNITAAKAEKVMLKVTDMQGRLVFEKQVNLQAGENQIIIDELGSTYSGIYFVNIITATESLVQRIAKAK